MSSTKRQLSVRRRPSVKHIWKYFVMIFISGLVSVYDIVLTIVFAETLQRWEQNPIASAIISYAGVPMLVQLKVIGTIVATGAMCGLIYTKYRVSIIPVFIFQLLLFCYLTGFTNTNIFSSDVLLPIKHFIEFYQGNFEW